MRVATHDGSFHADEVFAVAALSLVDDPLEVVRTRDEDAQAACDVRVDVGLRDDPGTCRDSSGSSPTGETFRVPGRDWAARTSSR